MHFISKIRDESEDKCSVLSSHVYCFSSHTICAAALDLYGMLPYACPGRTLDLILVVYTHAMPTLYPSRTFSWSSENNKREGYFMLVLVAVDKAPHSPFVPNPVPLLAPKLRSITDSNERSEEDSSRPDEPFSRKMLGVMRGRLKFVLNAYKLAGRLLVQILIVACHCRMFTSATRVFILGRKFGFSLPRRRHLSSFSEYLQ